MINLSGKSFLVVEDEDMNFVYIRQIFKFTKGNVHRVKTGNEAIEASKTHEFNLILMDIQLPDISGIEATKSIREFNKSVPIIALTACRTPYDLEKAIESGCNDYLIKPFKVEDFSAMVTKYLS